MSRAGFRYVLNYAAWSGSARQVLAFADAAKAAEMKVIWPLNHRAWRDAAANPLGLDLLTTYGSLSSSCLGCLLNSQLLLFAINLVKNHPATWGFYIGDELPPAEASRVDVLAKKTKSIAPAKPHLYVARPGVANLAPFAPLTDVLGADAYPVGSADPGVGSVAGDTRGLARSHGKGSVLVLQAFSWSQYSPQSPYAFPGQKRMRRMRNSAIRSGRPDLVLWYSFHDIFRSATPNENWRALRKAAFSPGPKKVRRKKSPRRRGKPHPPGATQARNR